MKLHPKRDGIEVRAQRGGYELRDATSDGSTLAGHFAIFDTWTEISGWEGNFMERIARGAAKKTIADNGTNMRVLFNHGHDVMGDQVLGQIESLSEDQVGAAYEVKLFDGVPQLIQDGLRANQYGSSFRFRVVRESVNESPKPSDQNPKGLPERTIQEMDVMEFGPVTFPAYAGADAGMRSMTEEYIATRIGAEKLRALTSKDAALFDPNVTPDREAPSDDDAGDPATSSDESREDPTEPTPDPIRSQPMDANKTLEELEAREEEIGRDLERMDADLGTAVMDETQKAQWTALVDERKEIKTQAKAKRARLADLATRSEDDDRSERPHVPNVIRHQSVDDIYDLSTIRGAYDNPEYARQQFMDGAFRAIEKMSFENLGGGKHNDYNGSKEERADRAAWLVENADGENAEISRRILTAGHPTYEAAFWKKMSGRHLSSAEDAILERALSTSTAGYAVPIALDPTVSLTSNGVVNPLRAVARVVTVTGEQWKGVNSAGVTASYDAEAQEVSDDTPTLTQPSTTVLTARAFVPFSIESEDWTDLRGELTNEFQDAKDTLEGTNFTVGTGSPLPQGIMVGATNLATTAGTAAIALADLDTLTDALPPRYQGGAVIMAHRKFFSKVRQIARTTGVTEEFAPTREGFPATLLGYPRYENSNIVSTLTTSTALVAVVGDFRKGFVIVDRIGMNVELIPHLFATANNLPSGQRGLFAYWRNTSVVTVAGAFRALKIL